MTKDVAQAPTAQTKSREFPLDQWFDCTRHIGRDAVEEAEAQMALYAVKDGLEPDGSEARRAYREMRSAVRSHNACLRRDRQEHRSK